MYTKQTWKNGDVITEDKLNHMEDGIANAGGALIVKEKSYDESTGRAILDKTWKEIKSAMDRGTIVLYRSETSGASVNAMYSIFTNYNVSAEEDSYKLSVYDFSMKQSVLYTTDSENGYPAHDFVEG